MAKIMVPKRRAKSPHQVRFHRPGNGLAKVRPMTAKEMMTLTLGEKDPVLGNQVAKGLRTGPR